MRRPDSKTCHGVIQFVGYVALLGEGAWVGVQFDEPAGHCNGRIQGQRFFDCPPKHGGFYRPEEVELEPVDLEVADADDAVGASAPQDRSRTPSPTTVAGETSGSSSAAAAEQTVVTGRGLHTAVVNQLAQFVITAHDASGARCTAGGDNFTVAVRGVKPPSNLRVKLCDHQNGVYTVEFRAQVSGQLEVHIWLNGKLLPRCPYSAEAVTLRPEPSMCVLRGESLRSAVARKPQAFDIDFVSALGHVAYAEELDVRVERIQQHNGVFSNSSCRWHLCSNRVECRCGGSY